MDIEADVLLENIEKKNRHLMSRFSPDACIDMLDRVPANQSYHDLPADVTDMWKAILAEFGETGFQAFQNITMLRLIVRFDERRASHIYTDAILDCFDRSYRRIAASIQDPSFTKYRSLNDILLKDLALCRQFMFPAGARVVERDAAFARILLLRGGFGQAWRLMRLLFKTGGHDHWYRGHVHLGELEDFTAEGWTAFCLRIADMLASNPQVRGLLGGSWFYDPAIKTVSPHLGYLGDLPTRNGACVFFSNIDIRGGALSKSRTRRNACEAGTYLPKSYTLVWPRRELLAWADKTRQHI